MSAGVETKASGPAAGSAENARGADAEPRAGGVGEGAKKASRAAVWAAAGYGGGAVIRFGSNICLAWLVAPDVFGLMTIANMYVRGLELFSDVGIGPSVIRHKDMNDRVFIDTAWTIGVIRGVVLAVICAAMGWPLSKLYDEPKLIWLMPLIALTPLISGAYSTSILVLNRAMALKTLTLYEMAMQVLGAVSRVVLTCIWPTAASLVLGGVVAYIARLYCSHRVLPGERNRFRIDRESARQMVRFGRWIFLSTAITFLAGQADRLLLASLIPLGMLGVYGIALTVAILPQQVVVGVSQKVLFPSLAERATGGQAALMRAVERARRVLLPIGVGSVVVTAAISPWFFEQLYAPAYHGAGWMTPLLVLSAWFAILTGTMDRVLLVLGESRPLAASNAANLVVTVGAALAGHWLAGLPGFIAGTGVGTLAGYVVIAVRLARVGIPTLRHDVWPTALVVVGALGGGLAPQWCPMMFGEWGEGASIAVAMVVGMAGAAYAGRAALPYLSRG